MTKRRRRKLRQSRPPSRRWPPLQTIAKTSWTSSRPSQSSLHDSSRPHSPFVRTSTRVWFRCWIDINLPTPPKPAPQDHMGLTGVLTNVATRFHTAGALCPVVAAQREAEKETKRLDCLPPTAQRVILATSTTNGTSIPTLPPLTIHFFLKARNVTAL